MAHVAILIHEHARLDSPNYVLWELTHLWREQGHTISILAGTARHVPADVLFVHVDLTVVPRDYRAFAARYPRTINAGSVDISKRAISQNLLTRRDTYTGPVIVKTNFNFGGQKEAALEAHTSKIRRRVRRIRNVLPWPCRSEIPTTEYKVFRSIREVPTLVWLNPALVVERFLPERRGELYCLRTWNFLGSQGVHFVRTCPHPVIKARGAGPREPAGPVPDVLIERRRELAIDFGKFDYTLHDGRPVLFDTNRTPTIAAESNGAFRHIFETLARGLDDFLDQPAQLQPPRSSADRYNSPV